MPPKYCVKAWVSKTLQYNPDLAVEIFDSVRRSGKEAIFCSGEKMMWLRYYYSGWFFSDGNPNLYIKNSSERRYGCLPDDRDGEETCGERTSAIQLISSFIPDSCLVTYPSFEKLETPVEISDYCNGVEVYRYRGKKIVGEYYCNGCIDDCFDDCFDEKLTQKEWKKIVKELVVKED